MYKNFSFPLLFLIIILIFRKEFSGLLNRVRHISVENNAGKVSFSLAEINRLKSEMEESEKFQIRQMEGKDPRENVSLGAGTRSKKESKEEDKFNKYFYLINEPKRTFIELAKNGHIRTIEHLYNAYDFLTKDYQKDNHEPTKIIKNIYITVMDINEEGGYLLDDELVYNYRSFIQLTYLELEQKNNKTERRN